MNTWKLCLPGNYMVNNDICREQIIQLLVTMSNAILRSDEANLVSEMKTEEVNQIIAKRLSRRCPACMINADVQIGPQAAGPGIEPSVPMVGTYPAAPGAGDCSRAAQLGPWADPTSVPSLLPKYTSCLPRHTLCFLKLL